MSSNIFDYMSCFYNVHSMSLLSFNPGVSERDGHWGGGTRMTAHHKQGIGSTQNLIIHRNTCREIP